MSRFEREKSNGHVKLYALAEGYMLEYADGTNLKFRFKDKTRSELGIPITCRDLRSSDGSAYHPELSKIVRNPDPHKRYIEVGAGLGEFAPRIRGIVVIDPANYLLMLEMLKEIKPDVGWLDRIRLAKLVRRCEAILDPARVTLINKTLQGAVENHPDLLESADVVVDNNGAFEWGWIEKFRSNGWRGFEEIMAAEQRLVKENGLLYYNQETVYQKQEGKMVAIR